MTAFVLRRELASVLVSLALRPYWKFMKRLRIVKDPPIVIR